MTVHVPAGFTWDQKGFRYRVYTCFSVASPARETLEVRFLFGQPARVNWSLEFVKNA